MGHYYSEMVGPPFDFFVKCKLKDQQKEEIRKKFNLGRAVSDINLTYNTITTDKSRKWFEIHYNAENNCFIPTGIAKITELFGDKIVSKYDQQIEKQREILISNNTPE